MEAVEEATGFQTLIGTVKRMTSSAWGYLKGPVSNPHRYGQKKRS